MLWVLTDACYRGKLKEVIHLLSGDHVDVNEFFKVPRLEVQWTPLTSAAMGGQTTLVKILIDRYGARVDNPNTRGMTALTAAAFAGFPEICQILLDHGANIEAPGLRGETALIGAASGGHGTTVDLLMKNGANVEAVDENGRTALMKAARFGCTGTVDLLVTRYGADCSVKDNDGMTAQMHATDEGKEDVATLIGTLSACPEIFEARKTLDDLYKKVEAALDRQLVAESKMDELTRQLCNEDKLMLEEKKEKSIEKHIESEDLLVDYQRRLIQAGDGGAIELSGPGPMVFKEAVDIVEENTRQAEAEMLSFVHLVEDISGKLDRYGVIKEELTATKERILASADWLEGLIASLPEWTNEQGSNVERNVNALKEQVGVLRILRGYVTAGGDGAVGRAGENSATKKIPEGEEDAFEKMVELCEKEVRNAAKTKPVAEFLPRLELYLTSLKSLEKTLEESKLTIDLGFTFADGGKTAGPVNRVGPPDGSQDDRDATAGSDADVPADNMSAAAEEKDGIGSSSACLSINAMDASQVLGLLEIKLDSETYAAKAPRRSHRSWQMTKRSSADRSADLNTAEKIADLLQKSKNNKAGS